MSKKNSLTYFVKSASHYLEENLAVKLNLIHTNQKNDEEGYMTERTFKANPENEKDGLVEVKNFKPDHVLQNKFSIDPDIDTYLVRVIYPKEEGRFNLYLQVGKKGKPFIAGGDFAGGLGHGEKFISVSKGVLKAVKKGVKGKM